MHGVALKLQEFFDHNVHVGFPHTKALFAVTNVTCIITNFYYCIAAKCRDDDTQVVNLIEYPPDEFPHRAQHPRPFPKVYCIHVRHLGRRQEDLHNLWEDVLNTSTLPHGSLGFWFLPFKRVFLDHVPPNIHTHLMREDIFEAPKLAAKADEIWQSSYFISVNDVSPTDSINALRQQFQPVTASSVAPRPASRA